jgi:hypothetical protein
MIDVKNLMVGNWIYLSDPEDRENTREISYIDEVCRDCIRVEDFGDFFEDIYLEPIPVTVDMLKRIGFEEDFALARFYRYWDKDYKYKLDVDEGYTNSGKKWSIHIDNGDCATIGSGEFDHIHELMNLVKVITGQSLPITKDMLE